MVSKHIGQSSINWLALAMGGNALIQLVNAAVNGAGFEFTAENIEYIGYFVASVAVFVRRTFYEVKPIRKKKA